MNSYRYSYTYDANGNMVTGQNETWQGGVWVPGNDSFSFGDIAGNYYSWSGSLVMLRYRVITTDVAQGSGEMPTQLELTQNYPNPFNPSTTIRYSLPHTSFVTLSVYNTLGQEVAQLVNEQQQPGYHEAVFRGDRLASGVYFYRLEAGQFTSVKKLLLVK